MEKVKDNKEKRPMHEDHRARVRRRIEEYGLESLAEHEVLEYLLFFAIPRQDTNPIAHRLLARFHTLPNVLEASVKELCAVEGVGPSTARFLHMLAETDRYLDICRSKTLRKLSNAQEYAAYLIPQLRGMVRENMLMLALDERGRLLRTIWLEYGTVGAVEVSVAKVASEALSAGASAVVLAHNHPSGSPLPSQADVITTGEIMRALATLQIRVLDHIIVAGGEYTSMKETKRMPMFDARTGQYFISN